MILKDLTPKYDVKGGDPISASPTPLPASISELRAALGLGSNGAGVWKMVAAILASILVTLIGSWAALGFDAVKHSEIEAIMAARAPYIHDKQRIWDKFDQLTAKQNDQDRRILLNEAQIAIISPDVREIKTKIDDLTILLQDGQPKRKP